VCVCVYISIVCVCVSVCMGFTFLFAEEILSSSSYICSVQCASILYESQHRKNLKWSIRVCIILRRLLIEAKMTLYICTIIYYGACVCVSVCLSMCIMCNYVVQQLIAAVESKPYQMLQMRCTWPSIDISCQQH
jgi:hypothetical protein